MRFDFLDAEPPTPLSLWPDPSFLGTATDLYQLTMMAGYYETGMADSDATFELFVRRLPEGRRYLVFAGLEQAVGDLLRLAFSREQIAYLRTLEVFNKVGAEFFEWLASVRFNGDLYSVAEGTIVFGGEPLVRVRAPLPIAQWVETHLLASLNYPTLVASKASRIVQAAAGRPVYDFGARRGHGPHSAFLAARAGAIAGVSGTSHVEAGRRLGLPVVGTMAHSWIQSFATEFEAYQAFAHVFGANTILLVDTYQTLEGVRTAARLEPAPKAIRIDSGDLTALTSRARTILDQAGRNSVKIIVSGDLDEFKIAELVGQGAPIDSFGVGTQLITSADAPALSMVYKLVELNGVGRIKLSSGKKTYPMAKQIHRLIDGSGRFAKDMVTLAGEAAPGQALLEPVLQKGKLVRAVPGYSSAHMHYLEQINRLPTQFTSLASTSTYPLEYSLKLQDKARELGVI